MNKKVNKPVFIIAEAGVNHNGNINIAKQLIDAAVEAGVDAVKFQTWKTELLVTKEATQAGYQTDNTGIKESQFDMLKRLELSYDEFRELKRYCDKKNIMFLSTPDEFESADFLNGLQDIFKIGSSDLTNTPFLRHIANFRKPIVLSSGMGTILEIEHALQLFEDEKLIRDKITVLHATTAYPTPVADVNLLAMLTIERAFPGIQIGYSDHTQGIEVSIAAVALGAKVIEKHFTLDKTMSGPDHSTSLEPDELKQMVQAIRNVELAMGTGYKEPTASEKTNKNCVCKSLVAKISISQGEKFTPDNVTVKRSIEGGISAMRWDEVMGQIAMKAYQKDELV
ncbi:hypothetical protein TI05_08050 [Achromatium sp. WMS3]|nr:hypothetical protein TI05_08050 [Achromatium sp. WMS3]